MKNTPQLLLLLALLVGGPCASYSQAQTRPPLPVAPRPTPVLTLGVFHFDYPGRDVHKTDKSEEIDVLDARHQQELEALTRALQQFRPTHVLVEWEPAQQARLDSLYLAYRTGRHRLNRNEIQQVGFRLARQLHLPRVWAVDADEVFSDEWQQRLGDSVRLNKFLRYYEHNEQSPDSALLRQYKQLYTAQDRFTARYGITASLAALNDPAVLRAGQGPYLLGVFDYEETPGDFTGTDFQVGWYGRNLRILRNLRRIPRTPNTRILLLIGAGHVGLLNQFRTYAKVGRVPVARSSRFAHRRTESSGSQQRGAKLALRATTALRKSYNY